MGRKWEANQREEKNLSLLIRRLTSQWSGRLRAAHFGAAHRRVRRHMTKPRASGSIRIMKVATGIVVDGKVVVEGTALAEGSTVTVMLRESDDTFTLRPEDENELLESIAALGPLPGRRLRVVRIAVTNVLPDRRLVARLIQVRSSKVVVHVDRSRARGNESHDWSIQRQT